MGVAVLGAVFPGPESRVATWLGVGVPVPLVPLGMGPEAFCADPVDADEVEEDDALYVPTDRGFSMLAFLVLIIASAPPQVSIYVEEASAMGPREPRASP